MGFGLGFGLDARLGECGRGEDAQLERAAVGRGERAVGRARGVAPVLVDELVGQPVGRPVRVLAALDASPGGVDPGVALVEGRLDGRKNTKYCNRLV